MEEGVECPDEELDFGLPPLVEAQNFAFSSGEAFLTQVR